MPNTNIFMPIDDGFIFDDDLVNSLPEPARTQALAYRASIQKPANHYLEEKRFVKYSPRRR